ncbi:MAG: GTP-binding protein [Hyphomicrobiales bacterium]|nr:MAG: GTP-binding protein [Hyphomicrobiales bacterium]
MNKPAPIKITILTGFLGAGKTTVLNEVLQDKRFAGTMVIINEFGDVGLDHLMVENTENDMLVMQSGCICCSIRGDLVTTFEKILRDVDNKRIKPIDHIIIETTGIASPGPIIASFLSHPYLHLRFNLSQIITIADATAITDTLNAHEEAQTQLGMADQIIISKTDLVAQDKLPEILSNIARYAPKTPIHIKQDIKIADLIFSQGKTKHDQNTHHSHHHSGSHHHQHDQNAHQEIDSLSFSQDGAYNQQQLWNFLDILRSEYGANILRIKGIVTFDDAPKKTYAIHAVQHLLFPAKALDIKFSGQSELVIIGKALNKGKIQGLYRAFLGQIRHDEPDQAAIEDNPLSLLGASINTGKN